MVKHIYTVITIATVLLRIDVVFLPQLRPDAYFPFRLFHELKRKRNDKVITLWSQRNIFYVDLLF